MWQDGFIRIALVICLLFATVLLMAADAVLANSQASSMRDSSQTPPLFTQSAEVSGFADGLILLAMSMLLAICSGEEIERLVGTSALLSSWARLVFVGVGVLAFICNVVLTFAIHSDITTNNSIARLYSSLVLLIETFGLGWILLRLHRVLNCAKHRLSLTATAISSSSSPLSLSPYPISNTAYLFGVQILDSMARTGAILFFVSLIRVAMLLAVDIDQVSGSHNIANNTAARGMLTGFGNVSALLMIPLILLIAFPLRGDIAMGIMRQIPFF